MAETKAEGALELIADEKGLSAGLAFTPEDGGKEYDAEGLAGFLREQGIQHGLKSGALEGAIKEFATATGRVELADLVEGTAPVDAQGASYEWEELELPEGLVQEAERTLAQAPGPEIFITRIEKIKQQRTVLRKSRIPFLPAKEVTEELIEKREHRERVEVDPTVRARGWVTEGTLVARISPGRPGKPGRNVYGASIAPGGVNAEFYCGTGIEPRKNEIYALETGFLRRGENWADILPYTLHQWEVRLSEDQNSAYLDFNPGHKESVPPVAEDVVAALGELGYPTEKLIPTEAIGQLIAASLDSGEPLVGAGISVDEESHFSVDVSEDKLKAFLSLQKHRGSGKPLILKEVGAAISGAGFKRLNKEAVRATILEFYKSPAAALKNHLLLEGKAPRAAEDDSFSLTLSYLPDSDAAPIQERALSIVTEGRMDFDSLDEYPLAKVERLAMVKQDQQIGEIIKGKPGEAGSDVFGAKIDAPAGKSAAIKTFENLRIENDLIIAEREGILEQGTDDGVTLLRLHPHRDAEVSVRLAEDRMSAVLQLTAPMGTGFPATEDTLRTALERAGVVKGIDDEALTELAGRLARGEEVEETVVARGTAPKDAGKVEVEFKLNFATGKGVTIADDGHADYRRQDKLTSVTEGQLIAEVRVPIGDSEPGWDVTGKTISARELKQIPLEAGPGIEVRKGGEGLSRFYAAQAGELLRARNRLEVKSIHPVAGDVDMKSGNIKFSGSVHIKGSVQPGFVVFSGGDVRIGGTVDGALVSSEGSIYIAQGVKGGEKAVLRSKKDVVASFIEQARVMAVGNIRVKNSCLRASIRCNGSLQLAGDKGNLIGGSLKSREGAAVQNLGHPNGIPTQISFGQDYLIADRIEVEEREIDKVKTMIVKIDTMLHRLELAGEKTKLARARQEKLKWLKVIEKRSLRLFTLREKFEEHHDSQILVRGTLYPGVIFESHGRYYESDRPRQAARVVFNTEVGKIQLEEKKE